MMKLAFYFLINWIFAKFMEGIIFTQGFIVVAAAFFGFKLPTLDQLPDSIKNLFDNGVGGFKFWDIIKILAVILVIWEYFNFWNAQKSMGRTVSPITTGVFISIIAILGITTVPELVKKVKMTDFKLENFR